MTQTVLILGANGKIGAHAQKAFSEAGWRVLRYQRGTDMAKAAMGADVIVNGLNPPNYHNWSKIIPEITDQVIAAAKASGATVVIPGNVYNFGCQGGEWTEATPQQPCSRKGKIRKDMEERYRNAGIKTVILRAGNFIDPDREDDVMTMIHMKSLAKGKVGIAAKPDVIQSYCYIPDWARAVVALCEKREQLADFEDIPFPGYSVSATELRAIFENLLSQKLEYARFPWWIISLLSPVWELAREMKEMRYLWETSHWLGRVKFDELIPDFEETPIRDALAASLPANIYPNKVVRSGSQSVLT